MVAGMMVVIVLHELLPTAHHYDPHDAVTTNALLIGMAVMAISLTLFLIK
jgi:zinc transporter ZupT